MSTPNFSSQQAEVLQTFMTDHHRPFGTLPYPQLAGFLFAVCCCPETVPADDWMSVIFDDQDPGFFNEKEDKTIQELLVTLLHWTQNRIKEKNYTPPTGCEASDDVMDNFSDQHGFSGWCQGFLIGHDWLEEIWDTHLDEQSAEELAEALMTLSCFANLDLAQQWHGESADKELGFDAFLVQQLSLFHKALQGYAKLGLA